MSSIGLLQNIDSIQIPVPDLDTGVHIYMDQLGHHLIWRTADRAGLRMPGSNTELILVPQGEALEVIFHAASADSVAERIVEAGGKVLVEPYDIVNGRAVVIQDPFGNRYRIHDNSLGELVTDKDGQILGTEAGINSGA